MLDEVFEEEWMEGQQMHVATATISDYMKDFETFLVPFWADKFIMTILEEVILAYTKTLLFRKQLDLKNKSNLLSSESGKKKMFSSFFLQKKSTFSTFDSNVNNADMIDNPTGVSTTHVPVDEESLGRLAQDVNILNAFFSLKAGQDIATEVLQLINEVSLMLFVDLQTLINHVCIRINEYPSAAIHIIEVAIAVMKLRTFTKNQIELFTTSLKSVVDTAPSEAIRCEQAGIAEGRMGLLFIDVASTAIVASSSVSSNSSGGMKKMTLAQRMKVMANIPLFGGKRIVKSPPTTTTTLTKKDDNDSLNNSEHGGGTSVTNSRVPSGRFTSPIIAANNNTNNQLIEDVMEVLQQHDLAIDTNEHLLAQQQALEEAEYARRKAGFISYEGYLEKKSPAHNLWQRRYFKFTTRVHDDNQSFVYTLMWFKKEGGSIIKSLEVDKIDNIAMLTMPRAMGYLPYPRHQLMLMSEATSTLSSTVIAVQEMEHAETTLTTMTTTTATLTKALRIEEQALFTFIITQTDGKEHLLRGTKVDRVMKWINTIATTANLAYDTKEKCWTRTAFDYYKHLEEERKSMPSFENVSASPLPTVAIGRVGVSRSYSTDFTSPDNNIPPPASPTVYNSASAAALIKNAKRLSMCNYSSEANDFNASLQALGVRDVVDDDEGGGGDDFDDNTEFTSPHRNASDDHMATVAVEEVSTPRRSPLQRLSRKLSAALISTALDAEDEVARICKAEEDEEAAAEKAKEEEDVMHTNNPLQRKHSISTDNPLAKMTSRASMHKTLSASTVAAATPAVSEPVVNAADEALPVAAPPAAPATDSPSISTAASIKKSKSSSHEDFTVSPMMMMMMTASSTAMDINAPVAKSSPAMAAARRKSFANRKLPGVAVSPAAEIKLVESKVEVTKVDIKTEVEEEEEAKPQVAVAPAEKEKEKEKARDEDEVVQSPMGHHDRPPAMAMPPLPAAAPLPSSSPVPFNPKKLVGTPTAASAAIATINKEFFDINPLPPLPPPSYSPSQTDSPGSKKSAMKPRPSSSGGSVTEGGSSMRSSEILLGSNSNDRDSVVTVNLDDDKPRNKPTRSVSFQIDDRDESSIQKQITLQQQQQRKKANSFEISDEDNLLAIGNEKKKGCPCTIL